MTLELVGVKKKYPGFSLGPIDLKIENKKILVIIGPTGSGKSTILNLVAGLLKPDSGSILLDGIDITNTSVHLRKIGITFQNPSLFPNMNPYNNIVFGLSRKDRNEKEPHIRKLLEDLAITHIIDRDIQGLSGGETQKVSLARMLVTDPKIMLMDEPLAHLDVETRRVLRLELRRILLDRNVPSIYVTHFEDDVYALADYVAILHDGLIAHTNKIESILSRQNENLLPFVSTMFDETNYLEGKVTHSAHGITTFNIGSHTVEILGHFSIGSRVGILVKPEDIILSRETVITSARNLVKAEITNMVDNVNRDGVIDVHLKVDRFHVVSRITEQARKELRLQKQEHIFVIFKASAPQIIRDE
ncbi:MAG: ATP-binding cassette domain-containing protein [Nitrososphaeraceae archaeon]